MTEICLQITIIITANNLLKEKPRQPLPSYSTAFK